MSAERVRAARELLGLNQSDLADLTGLSQGFISQLERGQKATSEQTLRLVAESTGLPWRFFTRESPALTEDSLRFRKFRTASARESARARRTFRELAGMANELMQWAGQPAPHLPTSTVAVLTGNDIEALALETRGVLGLHADEPVRHLTRTLERASIPVAPIVFAELSGSERDEVAAVGHFGLSAWSGDRERPVIGYFPSNGDRQRFTLAHEVGHLVLHEATTADEAQEAEADRFAGALLLPEPSARAEMSPRMTLRDLAVIKARWGISIQALIMRGFNLGVIDAERRSSLFKQVSSRGWRRDEPVSVKEETPMLLGALVERRYGGRGNVYLNASRELGLPPVHLRATMPSTSAATTSS